MSEKPKALQLADLLEQANDGMAGSLRLMVRVKSAAELRRLRAQNVMLLEALEALMRLDVAKDELRYLDKGIGTATPHAAWLHARAAIAATKEQQ